MLILYVRCMTCLRFLSCFTRVFSAAHNSKLQVLRELLAMNPSAMPFLPVPTQKVFPLAFLLFYLSIFVIAWMLVFLISYSRGFQAVDPLGISNITTRFAFFGGEEVALFSFYKMNGGVWYSSAYASLAVAGRG